MIPSQFYISVHFFLSAVNWMKQTLAFTRFYTALWKLRALMDMVISAAEKHLLWAVYGFFLHMLRVSNLYTEERNYIYYRFKFELFLYVKWNCFPRQFLFVIVMRCAWCRVIKYQANKRGMKPSWIFVYEKPHVEHSLYINLSIFKQRKSTPLKHITAWTFY